MFSESRLNFLKKKVALRPPIPFAMPRRARRRSETYELVFFKKTFLCRPERVNAVYVKLLASVCYADIKQVCFWTT